MRPRSTCAIVRAATARSPRPIAVICMIVRTVKVVVFAFLAALLSLAGPYSIGLRQQHRARKFLRDVTKLKLGAATFADAERLADRYGGEPWNAIPSLAMCTSSQCYLIFKFPNPRNYLPFFSKVLFGGLVHVKDGTVVSVEISYECDSRLGWAAYDVTETPGGNFPDDRVHHWQYFGYEWKSPAYGVRPLHVDGNGVPWVLQVLLGKNANAGERSDALAFDLSCLAKLYDCRTPSSIYPAKMLRLAVNESWPTPNAPLVRK